MRKFIILCLMAFIVCSCYSTKTFVETYYGSITTFTPQGDTLKRWDNAFIEEETTTIETSSIYGSSSYKTSTNTAFKYFGLNFTDLDTGKGVVVHSGIPYIIEYNTSVEGKAKISTEEKVRQKTAESIRIKYHNYQNQIDTNKKSMRKLSRDSDEYKIKKEQNDAMRGAMKDLDEQYRELTGSYI